MTPRIYQHNWDIAYYVIHDKKIYQINQPPSVYQNSHKLVYYTDDSTSRFTTDFYV